MSNVRDSAAPPPAPPSSGYGMPEHQGPQPVKPKEMKPDEFIKLFLAQLKNQNPTSPTDSNTILQQMASIRGISATEDMQKTLKEVQEHLDYTLANNQVMGATQLIGKKVQIPSSKSPLGETDDLGGSVIMVEPATDVTVTIKDASGKVVKTMNLGNASSTGLMDFSWDGKDQDGNRLKADYYSISATGTVKGAPKVFDTAGAFKVKSVATRDGLVIFNVDGKGGVSLGDIIKIQQ